MSNPAKLKTSKRFIFCVHAHQPVGNFEKVFLEAYEKSYQPFFEALESHSSLKVNAHFSGSLIDWLEANRPEFIGTLRRLAEKGQIEFLGGGYYEPIFGAIPEKDLIDQIIRMREKLQSLFGQSPAGAWLTERVWDPKLLETLPAAGVAYTVLDNFHLERAGVASPLTGFYRAEGESGPLDFFTASKELRYLIPFARPEEAFFFLRSKKNGENQATVFADDIEKFGLWPGTAGWVYRDQWLHRFFELLENSREVRLSTFGECRRDFSPKKVEAIPHASYGEMMEWSGGSFYNFFQKYPESRYMKDRVWQVSAEIKRHDLNGHGDAARTALYKAQCNCAYWHGIFGGLYSHHLRSAIFENLIKAEKLLEPPAGRVSPYQEENLGSEVRWRVTQKNLTSFFNPDYGAAMEETDWLPASLNLMCNLRRRPEPYHEILSEKPFRFFHKERALSIHRFLGVKDKKMSRALVYDTDRKLSFMDHFFSDEVSLEEFKMMLYRESGDFVGMPYQASASNNRLLFQRQGTVTTDKVSGSVHLRKEIDADEVQGLKARYTIENTGENRLQFIFGVEFNFSIYEESVSDGFAETAVTKKIFKDAWRGVQIELSADQAMNLLCVPLETVSESESGMEKTHQGLSILFQKKIDLAPAQKWRQEIRFAVK